MIDLKLRAEIQKSAPHKVYQWGRAKWSRIKGETRAFATRFCSDSGRSVEDQWSSIEKHISKMIEEHVPSKFTKTRTDQPWVTPDLKRKCRKKHRLYKKWKRHCGGTRGLESGACRAAREEYKRYHKHTNSLLRKSRTRYIGKILGDDLDSGNNKAFWRYIKSQRTESSGVAPLKDKGQLCSGPLGKAKILANQFKSVFTRDKDEDKDTHLHGPGYPSIGNITFDTAGIEKLLRGVNPSKAAGPDQIPCRMLHELATELAPVFTKLFQNSYNTGILPHNWRNAWISPVFKKDDKSEASNYRPVSLTCVACKIMEHVVASHIRHFLDKHGILSPYQHGFRKKLSCESQLIMTTHDILKRLDKKDSVDMAILDFSKAFDVVPHTRLLRKLRLYGIQGPTLNWIEGFLSRRKQSVIVNGVRSDSHGTTEGDDVVSGVPQGTVLGPLMFLLYINDLPSVLDPGTTCRLFADDCLIYRSIESLSDQLAFQKDLDSLYSWGVTWGLSFNVSKCNIMHLSRSRCKLTRFYTLGGEVIKSVDSAKYLGVTISNNYGNRSSPWKAHITQLAAKAHQRLGFVRRSLRGASYSHREMAYLSLVRSLMDYAGAVWDPVETIEADKLEQVQRHAARWATGSWGVVSVTALLGELGWEDLGGRRGNQRLTLFYKILDNDSRYFDFTPDTLDLKFLE